MAKHISAPEPLIQIQVIPAAAPSPAPSAPLASSALQLRGDYWQVRFNGHEGMIEDCRGLRYIALLIRDAGPSKGPMHAKELVALATGSGRTSVELETHNPVLDNTARRQLVERLEQIAEERNRACAAQDFDRAAGLDAEYEQIADELSAAGGRRQGRAGFSDGSEKARKAVSKAISEAVARLAAHADLADLARHLTSAIRKGQWLSYSGGFDWIVDFSFPLPRK